MNGELLENSDLFDRIQAFVGASVNGEVTPAQLAEVEQLLRNSREARDLYVELVEMSVFLPRALTGVDNESSVVDNNSTDSRGPTARGEARPSLAPPIPSLSVFNVFGNTWRDTTSSLISHDLFVGYVVATVLFGVAAFVASHIYLPQHRGTGTEYVNSRLISPAPMPVKHDRGSEFVSLARITGMVDCVWRNENEAPFHNKIKLHDKFALKSGLLEITYHTGAKVILQGPCTYEVESPASGYLSLGKLTARVETAKPQAAKQNSPVPRPPSPLFAVRTPTVVVTDLGTEFGVEQKSDASSHIIVRTGEVMIQSMAEDKAIGTPVHLKTGEAVSVTHREIQRTASEGEPAKKFIWKMPKLTWRAPVLAHLWTFDADFNDAAGSLHGTAVGSSMIQSDGRAKIGAGCAAFAPGTDGDHNCSGGFVTLGKSSADVLNISGAMPFSLVVWMRKDGDFDYFAYMMGNEVWRDNIGFSLIYNGISKRLRFRFGHEDANNLFNKSIETNHVFTNADWHFVAATFDGAVRRLYVDGCVEAIEASSLRISMPSPSSASFCLGTSPQNPGQNNTTFHGSLDDAAVWKSALSFAQIAAIYNLGSQPAFRYGQKEAAALFALFAKQGESETIGGRTWTFRDRLPRAKSGSLVERSGGEWILYLDETAGLSTRLAATKIIGEKTKRQTNLSRHDDEKGDHKKGT